MSKAKIFYKKHMNKTTYINVFRIFAVLVYLR